MNEEEKLDKASEKEQTNSEDASDFDDVDFKELEESESSEDDNDIEEQEMSEIADEVEEIKPGSSGASYTFLKMPKPGESITLTLQKIEKKPGREMKRKSDGKEFTTGLYSKRSKSNTEFNLITTDNESLPINGWGLFYTILGKDSPVEKKAIEQGSYKGITFKITHVLNGQHGSLDAEDLKSIKGYDTIEEAEKYKKKINKAIEENKIYKVELIEPETKKAE